MKNILILLFCAISVVVLSACATGDDGGGQFDKMIVSERADYYIVPPTGGASPEGRFSRGTRLRIVGNLGGYLEVQAPGGKKYFVSPSDVGDLSDSPVQPRINF